MTSELCTFHGDLLAVANNYRRDPQIRDGAFHRMMTSEDPYVLVAAYHLGKDVPEITATVFDRFKYIHISPVDCITLWVMSPPNSHLRSWLLEKLAHSDEASFDQYLFGCRASVGRMDCEFRERFWRRMFRLASNWEQLQACYWLAKKGSDERQHTKESMEQYVDTFDRAMWLWTHCRPDDPIKGRMRAKLHELSAPEAEPVGTATDTATNDDTLPGIGAPGLV
ncbi:MAG: hypothetical protein HY341_01395 [Candidatus Kerfeldbacteria bacterium]|nr:hypothetical protein [Candidatus Kerfeldbacteria bacterium]